MKKFIATKTNEKNKKEAWVCIVEDKNGDQKFYGETKAEAEEEAKEWVSGGRAG